VTQVTEKTTAAKTETKKAPAKAVAGGKRTITIRLKKGLVACNPLQRATVSGLGLKRREQVRTLENTLSVRGMIKKVIHLVEIVSETR
jgi:large subunit ribosomal protein L30